MVNKVVLTPFFLKKAEKLIKKFTTLSKNLALIEQELIKNPKLRDSYGSYIYKVRVADESKGKGKGGVLE